MEPRNLRPIYILVADFIPSVATAAKHPQPCMRPIRAQRDANPCPLLHLSGG